MLIKTSYKSAIYEDVNHPGEFKLSPYGQDGKYELTLVPQADGSYLYGPAVVGSIDGYDVRVADWDADQGTDHSGDPSYRGYFDEEEGAWLFMSIWRKKNDEGKWSLMSYGYDALIPDE